MKMKMSAVAACVLAGLLLLCCGCQPSQPPASSAMESAASEQSEPAQTASADPSSDATASSPESESSPGAGPSQNYEIGWGYFDQDQIHIDYPVLSGLADADLQDKINGLIYNDICVRLVDAYRELHADEPDFFQTFIMDLTFRITLKTDDLLSIVYTGTAEIIGGGRPYSVIESTIIDMRTGDQLSLSDFVTVDESLVQRIRQADTIWSAPGEEPDLGELIRYIREDYDHFLRGLTEHWEGYTFFLTPNSLYISLGISRAAGDYSVV